MLLKHETERKKNKPNISAFSGFPKLKISFGIICNQLILAFQRGLDITPSYLFLSRRNAKETEKKYRGTSKDEEGYAVKFWR